MTSYKSRYGITLKRAKQISKTKMGRYPSIGSHIPVYRRRIVIRGLHGESLPGYETVSLYNWGGKLELYAIQGQFTICHEMDEY